MCRPRQSMTHFTTPLDNDRSQPSSLNSTSIASLLESLPHFQTSPESLTQLYVKSTTRTDGTSERVCKSEDGNVPLTILHEGQFPAVTLSFNLSPGSSLGAAVAAIQRAEKEIGLPETVSPTFSGSAAEFRSSLASEPFLIWLPLS